MHRICSKVQFVLVIIFVAWSPRFADCKASQISNFVSSGSQDAPRQLQPRDGRMAQHILEGLRVILAEGRDGAETTTESSDSGMSTGVMIAIIVGSIVGFIIIVSLLILIICKCCTCACCDEQSEMGELQDEAEYSNTARKQYREMHGQVQELQIPVQEPIPDQPYKGAMEQILIPFVAAPEPVMEPMPVLEEAHETHHEKKEKKEKKKHVEPELHQEPHIHEPAVIQPDVYTHPPMQAYPDTYGPVVPQQPEPGYGVFPHVTPEVDIPEYGDTAIRSEGPIITADRAITVDGSSHKFLPHLNFAAKSQPQVRATSEYSESQNPNYQYPGSQAYSASNQPGLRRATALPGARPLPGMANSSEFRTAYDKKLPRMG